MFGRRILRPFIEAGAQRLADTAQPRLAGEFSGPSLKHTAAGSPGIAAEFGRRILRPFIEAEGAVLSADQATDTFGRRILRPFIEAAGDRVAGPSGCMFGRRILRPFIEAHIK